jgi:hypothetical protein
LEEAWQYSVVTRWDARDWGALILSAVVIGLTTYGVSDVVLNNGDLGRGGPLSGVLIGGASIGWAFKSWSRGAIGESGKSRISERPVAFWSIFSMMMIFGVEILLVSIFVLVWP